MQHDNTSSLPTQEAVKTTAELMNEHSRNTLMGTLGIHYTNVEKDKVEATMPVNAHTCQPFGVLHGGATLALAETVAGAGSFLLCEPDEMAVGMQVSGSHVSSAPLGETVRAEARLVHGGRLSHVWSVQVYAVTTGKLISTVNVTNCVIKKRS